jgi:uncharacterized protein (DUF1778 family)
VNSNKKDKRIELRVTEEQKEKIQKLAEEKNTTVSALILNSIENNVTVYLDTSDYRDLVIQVRRIGTAFQIKEKTTLLFSSWLD